MAVLDRTTGCNPTFAGKVDAAIAHLQQRLRKSSVIQEKPILTQLTPQEKDDLEAMRVYQSLLSVKEKLS